MPAVVQPENGFKRAKQAKILFQIAGEQKAVGNGLPSFSPHLFPQSRIFQQLYDPVRGFLDRGNKETVDSVLNLGANTAKRSHQSRVSLSTLLRPR